MSSEIRKFPPFTKSFWQSIGPSLVTLGLGIGSGEYVLWPYMTSQYGFGILWGALLGISLQFIIISEIARYTMVKGESIVHGFARIHKLLPTWLIFSTLIGFGWPGFAATAAALLSNLFGIPSEYSRFVAIAILILCATLLLAGKNVYSKVETIQKFVVPFSFVILIFLFLRYFSLESMGEALVGLVGIGDGYFGLPKGLDFAVFLGAFAYAGSGGNFLLGQSFYVIEEETGNAKYAEKLSLHTPAPKHVESIKEHIVISEDPVSVENFRRARNFQLKESAIVFWALGFLMIFILSYLSRVLLQGVDNLPKTFEFIVFEARFIGNTSGAIFGILFIIIGAFALMSVQLGALDIMGRFTALAARISRKYRHVPLGDVYTKAVLLQMGFGIFLFLIGFSEPLWLVIIGAVINAFAMAIMTILVFIANTKHIPKAYQPGIVVKLILVFAITVYLVLFGINIFNVLT
jgi:MFS family permease